MSPTPWIHPRALAAARAARDEELRGECAKAFEHYKSGYLTRASELLKKLLARHPAHPLLHYAYGRLAHKRALAQRQPAGVNKYFDECIDRVEAAGIACPDSLLPYLLYVQILYDCPAHNDQVAEILDRCLAHPLHRRRRDPPQRRESGDRKGHRHVRRGGVYARALS